MESRSNRLRDRRRFVAIVALAAIILCRRKIRRAWTSTRPRYAIAHRLSRIFCLKFVRANHAGAPVLLALASGFLDWSLRSAVMLNPILG
jgi:hypothetical protein